MTIRRTIYGAVDQTALLLGCPLPEGFVKNSSVNTTLGIQPDAVSAAGENRLLRSFMIGIGAHAYTTGIGGIALPSTKNHLSTDAGLFLPIPFAIREIGDDLDETHRARLCLREVDTINGVVCAVYWGRRFDGTTAVITPLEQTVENGRVTESNVFVPTEANRKPVPTDTSNTNVNVLTGKVTRVSAPVDLVLDAADVAEIMNASMMLYGSEDYTHVSEIAMLVHSDRNIQSDNGGGATVAFKEAIQAEVYCHIPAQVPMKDQRAGLTLTYNVGAMEPLYVNGG